MKMRTLFSIAAAVCAVWLSGCTTTPDSRIKEDPETFAKLPPDQQALVKQGQVGLGFNMDAVRLAIGDPSHKTLMTTAAGRTEIWHYTQYQAEDGTLLYTGYYHRWGRFGGWGGPGWGGPGWGGPGWGPYPYFADYDVRIPRDYLKVTFNAQGLVTQVEQEQNPS